MAGERNYEKIFGYPVQMIQSPMVYRDGGGLISYRTVLTYLLFLKLF